MVDNGIVDVNVICFIAVFLNVGVSCITKAAQARRSREMMLGLVKLCASRLPSLTKRLLVVYRENHG